MGAAPPSCAGLLKDYDAVKVGLTLEWRNGQTEGQIHRLKLLKRQSYGRAGCETLRARVLHHGEAAGMKEGWFQFIRFA